jgi:hypothetical protein
LFEHGPFRRFSKAALKRQSASFLSGKFGGISSLDFLPAPAGFLKTLPSLLSTGYLTADRVVKKNSVEFFSVKIPNKEAKKCFNTALRNFLLKNT